MQARGAAASVAALGSCAEQAARGSVGAARPRARAGRAARAHGARGHHAAPSLCDHRARRSGDRRGTDAGRASSPTQRRRSARAAARRRGLRTGATDPRSLLAGRNRARSTAATQPAARAVRQRREPHHVARARGRRRTPRSGVSAREPAGLRLRAALGVGRLFGRRARAAARAVGAQHDLRLRQVPVDRHGVGRRRCAAAQAQAKERGPRAQARTVADRRADAGFSGDRLRGAGGGDRAGRGGARARTDRAAAHRGRRAALCAGESFL